MSRFIVSLTDDERAALERVRIAGGYRSHAETVRALIHHADAPMLIVPADMPPPDLKPGSVIWSAEAPVVFERRRFLLGEPAQTATGSATPNVPVAGTFERKPYQKGQKK